MSAFFDVVLPVFLVIIGGYVSVWRGVLSDASADGLMRFAMKIGVPTLLFRAMSTLDLSREFDLVLMGSYYVAATICFVLGYVGARLLFKRPAEDAVAIAFCCLFSNSMLLGVPISERAYGVDSLATNFALISIHSPFCYLLGITAMELIRNKGRTGTSTIKAILRAMFSNAIIIGIALGLAVNLSGLALPQAITDGVNLIAQAALPVALFGIGGILCRYRPEGDMTTVMYVVVISLIVHPVLMYSFGTWGDLRTEVLRSAVITAAMAPGINVYVFADMYGRARRVAATSVLVATAISSITVWGWLTILG
ncbi:AEC family transporter [Pseudoruegeria sp. SK021]|uniref:AEC family transporter n=1 Tax=Pseudoruegeria sp. SK021 TaxID=1933035 RepID=UPI000A260B02|nr:AEC family transporter [Pseudoruegeria sp. SK021]OSP56655.1 malonate transporter [Pseudoruegeria sp. SK021]